jgi:hypothetical protein
VRCAPLPFCAGEIGRSPGSPGPPPAGHHPHRLSPSDGHREFILCFLASLQPMALQDAAGFSSSCVFSHHPVTGGTLPCVARAPTALSHGPSPPPSRHHVSAAEYVVLRAVMGIGRDLPHLHRLQSPQCSAPPSGSPCDLRSQGVRRFVWFLPRLPQLHQLPG